MLACFDTYRSIRLDRRSKFRCKILITEPPMTENTDVQIRHIYGRWHETIVERDLDGLMALYAEDAILETPLILLRCLIGHKGF